MTLGDAVEAILDVFPGARPLGRDEAQTLTSPDPREEWADLVSRCHRAGVAIAWARMVWRARKGAQ